MEAKRAAGPTWDTLRYMIAIIQYGGHITDAQDQLLMNTYAESFFHQGVLASGYELFRDVRAKASYCVPQGNELEAYRHAIEELPAQESPGIFGLQANADITFRSLQVQAGVQLILDTRPAGGSTAGGASKEDLVDRLADDLLAKVLHGL